MEITTPLRLGTQLSEKIAILNVSNPIGINLLFKQTILAVEVLTTLVHNAFFSEKSVLVQDLSITIQETLVIIHGFLKF